MTHFFVPAAALVAVWGGVVFGDVLVDSGTPVGPANALEGKNDKAVYYDASTSSGQFISQSFTLTSGAIVSTIDSYFFAAPGVSVDVQLTTEIGPAATAADELARFTLTPTGTEPQYVSSPALAVFLPAGTYHLVYSATSSGAGFPDYAPLDIGDLTFANSLNGSASHINPTNPAASGFFPNTDEGDIGLRVHGTIPEPAAPAVLFLALTTAARRRR